MDSYPFLFPNSYPGRVGLSLSFLGAVLPYPRGRRKREQLKGVICLREFPSVHSFSFSGNEILIVQLPPGDFLRCLSNRWEVMF